MALTIYQSGVDMRPVIKAQSTDPSFVGVPTNTWTPLLTSEWGAASFTAPPSGKVFIALDAAIWNTVTTTSTLWCGWQLYDNVNGVIVESPSEANYLYIKGSSLGGSRRVYRELTPGGKYSISVFFRGSSFSTNVATTCIRHGQIIIEMIP